MVRIRLALSKTEQRAEPVVLFTGLPRPRPIWGPFSSAAITQALVVWLGASYLHFLAGLPDLPEPAALAAARVLEIDSNPDQQLHAPRIRIPDRGETSKKGAGRKAAPGPGSLSAPSNAGAAPALEANAGPPAPPSPAPLREFRMPEIPARQSAPQTLVQLDLPPTLDLHPQLQVPAVVMLSSEPARKIPKPFLAPPERKKTVPVPNQVVLDLRPPVFEADPGYVKPSALLQADPKLPAPVGGVSPVSGVSEPKPTTQAATMTAELPAPPVNVISLPTRPIPAGTSVVLPPLNQVSARDSVSGDGAVPRPAGATTAANTSAGGTDPNALAHSGGGRGDARPGAAASEGNSGGASASGQGSGAQAGTLARSLGAGGAGEAGAGSKTGSGGNGPRDSAGTGIGGSGGGSGASTAGLGPGAGNNAGPGAGIGPGAGAGRGSGAGVSGNSLNSAAELRIVRPITGNYDVAVVQSGASIPGTAAFLKGRPVYSVYLSLGGGREWILQYCLPPDEKRPAARSQVVTLGNVAPLTAPFAYLILKPTIQLRDGVRYGFIHAFVNASGRFDDVKEVGDPVIENVEAVIEAIEKWEFRPASKDGLPTLVEVLLCIPSA